MAELLSIEESNERLKIENAYLKGKIEVLEKITNLYSQDVSSNIKPSDLKIYNPLTGVDDGGVTFT
jgi:hypothetical protein